MDIATGQPESHDSLLPYDASQSPATARPTSIASAPSPVNQVGVFDATADQSARLSAYESDARAAMQAGMDARTSMLGHYQQAILPVGSAYGDAMSLPPVPPNAVPTEASDAYPYSGMEPTPAGVGFVHPSPLPE
jgi:hypothetical protein